MPRWNDRSNLPPTGPDGQVLTVQGGQWVAAPPAAASGGYDHEQAVASATWTVVHNLGTRPNVEARDAAGRVVEGGVTHLGVNALTIEFLSAIAGTARCS